MRSTNNIRATAVGTSTSVFTVQSLATYSKRNRWRCERGITLQIFMGDLVRFSCSFNHVNCAFTFLLRYHETPDTQQISSHHGVLHSLVVDVCKHKDFAVGRFTILAAGANATRKTARGGNWFSRSHYAG